MNWRWCYGQHQSRETAPSQHRAIFNGQALCICSIAIFPFCVLTGIIWPHYHITDGTLMIHSHRVSCAPWAYMWSWWLGILGLYWQEDQQHWIWGALRVMPEWRRDAPLVLPLAVKALEENCYLLLKNWLKYHSTRQGEKGNETMFKLTLSSKTLNQQGGQNGNALAGHWIPSGSNLH